jgi:hypothetical protein
MVAITISFNLKFLKYYFIIKTIIIHFKNALKKLVSIRFILIVNMIINL